MAYRNYVFRIYPSKKQISRLHRTFQQVTKVYNILLGEYEENYLESGTKFNKYDLCHRVIQIKRRYPELKAVYAQVLQNCADRINKTFNNYFMRVRQKDIGMRKKVGFPRFKKSLKSITYPQDGFEIKGRNKVSISKIGNVRAVIHRIPEGKIKTMTIVHKRSDKWFVIFSCEETLPLLTQKNKGNEIGIDLGLESLLTFSDGTHVDNPRFNNLNKKQISKLRRSVDKKKIGSNNRTRANLRLSRKYEEIVNKKRDFLHKLTRELVSNYSTIAIEELDISKLVEGGHFSKSINDASWGTFTNLLEYKAERAGVQVIKTGLFDATTKTCSRCGAKKDMPLSSRQYNCPHCGMSINRDINAALNILNISKIRAGQVRSYAWGDWISTCPKDKRIRSLNQELYSGTDSSVGNSAIRAGRMPLGRVSDAA